MCSLTQPASLLEQRIVAAGYIRQPVAPVEVLNDIVEMACPWCSATASLEPRPFWKGAKVRVVVRCVHCDNVEEV